MPPSVQSLAFHALESSDFDQIKSMMEQEAQAKALQLYKPIFDVADKTVHGFRNHRH